MTPEDYIAALPVDRAAALTHARALVNAALPLGYAERLSGSIIVWEVPLARYPATYNKQPLMLAALAAQKRHNALYLVCAYTDAARDAALRAAYAAAGRKLDMGRSCLRFETAEDLHDDAIRDLIANLPVETLIAGYEASHG